MTIPSLASTIFLRVLCIVALTLVFTPSLLVAADLKIGDAMPTDATEVEMMGVDDKTTTIAAQKGDKGTLVIFTCNHCPYVKKWDERIAELGNMALEMGVGVIAINANDPTEYPDDDLAGMKTRATSLGLKYPYVVDATSNIARTFGAKKTPDIFLFDADGKLVYKGAVDDNASDPTAVTKRYLDDAITALVSGGPLDVAETKSLGCSIKFRDE